MKIIKFFRNMFSGKHKKRNIWIAIILAIAVVLGFMMFGGKNKAGAIQTGFAKNQNLQETVLSTGQVVSGTDLALSFQSTGIVRRVNVKEGDKVYNGQLLASLNQSSALASLTSAQGSLASAQANYDKLINGATQNDVQSLQDAVSSAQVNLNNAFNGAFSTLNNGYTAIFNAYATVKTIQDTYFTSADLSWGPVHENTNNINNNLAIVKNGITYTSNTDAMNTAIANSANSLASVLASLQIIRDQTDLDTYTDRVLVADKTALDSQKTAVSSALSSVNALQSSLALYKVALQTAQHNLSAKQSPSRQEDIDSARAQVASAQGQVASAQSTISNMIIVAPASGIITSVDIKVGELATASKGAIVLQDIGNLHAEADVSEANVASLQVGQIIDYTFDALGPDKHFEGKVLTINPASTVISGVVNYKMKGSFDNVPGIKPGMTANMTILVAQKDNVLAVPSTAVINKNSKQYVRVVTDSKKKTYKEVQVQTGMQADGGLVEIISGLSDGQEIVVYIKL